MGRIIFKIIFNFCIIHPVKSFAKGKRKSKILFNRVNFITQRMTSKNGDQPLAGIFTFYFLIFIYVN
ncbi:hypothetical protein HY750_01350 [Candidatus Kuenenbacteria bacterium]|nr:hypothetical protein [Candidatus Kuenenbacteria bacterium]